MLKEKACDLLLNHRLDHKVRHKKYEDIQNRLYVAQVCAEICDAGAGDQFKGSCLIWGICQGRANLWCHWIAHACHHHTPTHAKHVSSILDSQNAAVRGLATRLFYVLAGPKFSSGLFSALFANTENSVLWRVCAIVRNQRTL